MKNKKSKYFTNFSPIDRRYLEQDFKEMAKKGWLIEKIGIFKYTFKKIEPIDLDFSVSIFQPTNFIDYSNSDESIDFQELCVESGWTLHCSNERFHVFSKMANDELPPIHTESIEEFKTIKKSIYKSESIYIFLILLQIFNISMFLNPFDYTILTNPQLLRSSILIILLFSFMAFPSFIWIFKNRNNAQNNEELAYPNYITGRIKRVVMQIILTYLLIKLILMPITFLVDDKITSMIFIIFWIIILGIVISTELIIRKKKFKWYVNLLIFGALVYITISLSVQLLLQMFIHSDQHDYASSNNTVISEKINSDYLITAENFGYTDATDFYLRYDNQTLLFEETFEYSFDIDIPEGSEYVKVVFIKPRNKFIYTKMIDLIVLTYEERLKRYGTYYDDSIYEINMDKYDTIINLDNDYNTYLIAYDNLIYVVNLKSDERFEDLMNSLK